MDESASWREVVDLDRLSGWMHHLALGDGPIRDPQPLAGGTQNILIAFWMGQRRFVLRKPPKHTTANGSETMRREARILSALAGTDVPHPGLIAACPDEDVLGAAFYLMEPVDGFNATVGLPELHAGEAKIRRGMGMAMADAAAALGRVDHLAAGLADFGKSGNFLARQVSRWRSQLESYASSVRWPGPASLPEVGQVGEWLDRHCPKNYRPGIVHGDFQISNLLFSRNGPSVAAILDWELATIGDPLMDLGWLLATWPDSDGTLGTFDIKPWAGFPSAAELVQRYSDGSTRDLSAIDWYTVLACYKLGILLEGTYARSCSGQASEAVGNRLHHLAINLFERALRRID
jgi:aminoglycoside phosphotransferase (APT) family kinase protein